MPYRARQRGEESSDQLIEQPACVARFPIDFLCLQYLRHDRTSLPPASSRCRWLKNQR
jgi:hypothetical protein